jgi:hypothetical protein
MPMPTILVVAPPAIEAPTGPMADKFRGAVDRGTHRAA